MNLDAIKSVNDAELLNDPEIAEILKPRRRSKPLCFAQVQKLVETLRMGKERHANLEAYQGDEQDVWRTWRLRFSLRDGAGKVMRKSIVIVDAAIASWVRDYLDAARKERPAYRMELLEDTKKQKQ